MKILIFTIFMLIFSHVVFSKDVNNLNDDYVCPNLDTIQRSLGYGDSLFIAKDYEKAILYFKEQADKGDYYAQDVLGDLFATGVGIEKNIDSALSYYNKASIAGNHTSLHKLGDIFYAPLYNLEQDYNKAFNYYLRAAKKGNPYCQYTVGVMYYNGQGIIKNLELSNKWINLSASQGYPLAIQYQKDTMYYKAYDILRKGLYLLCIISVIYSLRKHIAKTNKYQFLTSLIGKYIIKN